MKKVLLAMMMMMAVSAGTFAQSNRGANATPEQRAENQTQRMTEQLGLTDQQQKQVYALNLSRSQHMEAMRQDRMDMRGYQETYRKELMTILTPEQQQKYQGMQRDMRPRGNSELNRNDQGAPKGPKDKSGKMEKKVKKEKKMKKDHPHGKHDAHR
jgi:periplasmic protein CpxP/Spy